MGYGGTVCYSVRRKTDKISCGDIDPNERVNELLGLDFLRAAGVVIDLVELITEFYLENKGFVIN